MRCCWKVVGVKLSRKHDKLISGGIIKVLDRQSKVLLDSNLLTRMCYMFRLYLQMLSGTCIKIVTHKRTTLKFELRNINTLDLGGRAA